MSSVENNPIDYSNIKFTRDTKVDYKSGDTTVNTVFKIWDTDGSGDFNDEEWEKYQGMQTKLDNLKSSSNESVVTHYNKQARRINKQLEIMGTRIQSIAQVDYFQKLNNFEEAHNLIRTGILKNDEAQGNEIFDMAEFQMGDGNKIIYKKGYIKGLENLSQEDKQKYMELFEKSKDMLSQLKKIEKDYVKLLQDLDKVETLGEMAENGYITSVGSEEYENQVYQNAVGKMRSPENPYFNELQKYEQIYNELAGKERTPEINRQLENISRQIEQLKQASFRWLGSNNENIPQKGSGFQITDFSSNGTYTNDGESESISNTNSIGVRWDNTNWGFSTGFRQTDNYILGSSSQKTTNYNLMMGQDYRRGSLSINNTFNTNWSENNTNITDNLNLRYKNLSLSVGEEISKTKFEQFDDEGNTFTQTNTTSTTSVNAGLQLGKFNTSAGARFAEEGNTYNLGTGANFNIRAGEHINIGLSPSVDNSYNTQNKSYTLSTGGNVSFMGNWNNFNANLSMNENYSRTMQNGFKPDVNNTFGINGSVQYKNLSAELNFNDMDNQFSHSDTYGVNVSYNSKIGRFGAGYTYMENNNKMGGNPMYTNMVNVSYSAPLDIINKIFKKSHKGG